MRQFDDSKTLLIHAISEDDKMFFAWKSKDGYYITLEYIQGNYPDTIIVEWDSEDEFLNDIIWLDYIIDGIRCDDLKEKVLNLKNK